MSQLQYTMDSLEGLDPAVAELYSEQDGKHVLTGVTGVKSQADITRLQTALEKERAEHKATKDKAGVWGDLSHEDVMAKLDRIPELELAAAGKQEEIDAKLEELTQARVRSQLAPVERQNETLSKQNQELAERVAAYEQADLQRAIRENVRSVAGEQKIVQSAMPDVELLAQAVFERSADGAFLTKENPFGVTPGLDPLGFFAEMQPKRPHWWPVSEGGGASGSGGGSGFANNPFSAENWNMTKQGQMIAENRDLAERMAKAAGTTIGGQKPQPKK